MKLTKEKLKCIIQEEIARISEEGSPSADDLEIQVHGEVDELKGSYQVNGEPLNTWISNKIEYGNQWDGEDAGKLQSIFSKLEQILRIKNERS